MVPELDSLDMALNSKTSGLSIQDKLRASDVKRWHVVATKKTQSLAEHSFNVGIIAMEILKRFGEPENWAGEVARLALLHDIHEVREGDVPTPAKDKPSYDFSGTITPGMIVKMADTIEAFHFIRDNQIDRYGYKAVGYMRKMIDDMLNQLEFAYAAHLENIIKDLHSGEYTI
jgi:hypothetical protein